MFLRVELGSWFIALGNGLTEEHKPHTELEEGGVSTLQYPLTEQAPRLGFRLMGQGEIAEDV